MKRNRKIYIAAAACIGIGIVLTAGGILAGGMPGIALRSDGIHMLGEKEEDYILEKTELEEFSAVKIDVNNVDFYLIPSDGYYLEYYLSGAGQKPEYEVKNGTFVFEERPVANLVQFQIMDLNINGQHGGDYVNLYVPEDVYFDTFALYNDCGDVEIETLKGKSIEMELEYGSLSADSIEGEKLNLALDCGDLTLGTCKADDMEMLLEYGDLKIQSISGDSLTVDNSDGDVEINSLILEKKGTFTLDYGDAEVGFGDDISEYNIKLETEYGAIHAPEIGQYISEAGEESFRLEGTRAKELEIYSSCGDITVTK